MNQDLVIVILVVLAGFAFLFYYIGKKLSELSEKTKAEQSPLLEWLKSTRQSMDDNQKNLNQALEITNKNIRDTLQKQNEEINLRLDRAATVIGDLKKEAGTFSEIGKNMRDLQDYLRSPKLRGNVGEQVLNDLISQIFPKGNYAFQHQFKSGNKVDAVIKTDAGFLCIDSKFPMENFQRIYSATNDQEKELATREFTKNIKKHISDIAEKYILPDENTLDFAFMYVPSEPVYYEIVNNSELMEYSRERRIYPVSPTTLYANLQVLFLSFQGKKIEQKSREVFVLLRAIQKDYQKVDGAISVLGRHITNAYNAMSGVSQMFNILGQKLSSTKEIGEKDELPALPPEEKTLFENEPENL